MAFVRAYAFWTCSAKRIFAKSSLRRLNDLCTNGGEEEGKKVALRTYLIKVEGHIMPPRGDLCLVTLASKDIGLVVVKTPKRGVYALR